MVGVRAQGNLSRIVKTKAAANRNGNAARSAFHEASQHGRTGNHVGSASGGKNAMATSGNHIFQCLFEIGCCIKGAVKSDFEGASLLDECARALDIDGAAGEKCAEHDTGSAGTANGVNLIAHDREVGGIVTKSTGAGAHHYVNGSLALTYGLLYERVRRREALHFKRGAKFHTVCAAFLRGEAGFDCFRAQFEYHQTAQGSPLCVIDPNAAFPAVARSTLTLTNRNSDLRDMN